MPLAAKTKGGGVAKVASEMSSEVEKERERLSENSQYLTQIYSWTSQLGGMLSRSSEHS